MPQMFAGLDVSDQTTAICVLGPRGQRLFESTVASKPTAIATALKPYRRNLSGVALETGPISNWLYNQLAKRKLPMVCLDARHAQAALSARANKTDKNDAQDLARLLVRGVYTTAHIKSDEAVRIRTLLLMRKTLQRRAQDMQRTVRSTLKSIGASLVRRKGELTIAHDGGVFDKAVTEAVVTVWRSSEAMLHEMSALDRAVQRAAADDPVCSRLMEIPGVGPITALTFRSAVDNPRRFASSRTVGAYFGLTPKRRQSGQVDYSGRISKHGDRAVRTALYIAAGQLISASRSTCALRQWALRLKTRVGARKARVACARKLAVVMHRMWITGEDFKAQPVQTRPGQRRDSC